MDPFSPTTGDVAPARREVTAGRPGVARRLLGAALTTAIVMATIVAVVLAVATRLSPSGQYVLFDHPVMTVLSGSMTPVIRTGDLIVDDRLNPVQAEQLHVGQIISVREAPGSTTIITHRIVAVRSTGGATSYVTKGDANNNVDADLRPAADVIGVFNATVPRGGYVLFAVHKPSVLALLLATPVLWLLSGALLRYARSPDSLADSPGSR